MSKVLTEIPCTVDWDNETLTLSLVNDLVNIITFYKINPDEVFAMDENKTLDKTIGGICGDRVKDYLEQIGKSEEVCSNCKVEIENCDCGYDNR